MTDLNGEFNGVPAIVSPGPSLKENIDTLRNKEEGFSSSKSGERQVIPLEKDIEPDIVKVFRSLHDLKEIYTQSGMELNPNQVGRNLLRKMIISS